MAVPDYYLDSIGGSDSNNGSTWALRKATLTSVLSLSSAAGSIIGVTHNHSEVLSAHTLYSAVNTTSVLPMTLVSVDSTNGETYQVASNIQFDASSGVYDIRFFGSWDIIGVRLNAGSQIELNDSNGLILFKYCTMEAARISTTLTGVKCIIIGGSIKCTGFTYGLYFFAQTNLRMYDVVVNMPNLSTGDKMFNISGGNYGLIEAVACDFSNVGITDNTVDYLCAAPDNNCYYSRWLFRNCRMPAGLVNYMTTFNVASVGAYIELVGCYDGNSINKRAYQYYRESREGVIEHELTTIKTIDPASDGETDYAWKFTPTTIISNFSPLETSPMIRFIDAGPQILTIYLTSTYSLNDTEFWAECVSPSEVSLATGQNKRRSNEGEIFTSTSLDTTSGIWTSAKTNQYKIEFSVSPTEAGIVTIRCFLSKVNGGSDVVVVHPLIEVT